MSDQDGKPVEGDDVVADVESQDVATSEDPNTVQSQEAVVEDSTVTIKMSKRAARIGALLLAGFLGFLIGIVGAGVAHHVHDGHDGRGPGHMRIDDFGRQGPGQFGPGQGMMQGGQGGQGFGPDDQRGQGFGPGQGMMPGGPQEQGTPTPAATTK